MCRIFSEKIVEGVEEHFARRHPRKSFGKGESLWNQNDDDGSISKLDVMKLCNKSKMLSKEDKVKDVSMSLGQHIIPQIKVKKVAVVEEGVKSGSNSNPKDSATKNIQLKVMKR